MKKCRLVASLAAVVIATSVSYGQMMVVNGASFVPGPMAAGSFATIFGAGFCSQPTLAETMAPRQLPTTLGGASVMVNGISAMMQFCSPDQINFIVPPNLGHGMATLVVNNGSQTINGSMTIGPAGPGIFTMNGMGIGEGAMLHGSMWQRGPFSATTNGEPTPVSIFLTGLDLSSTPTVLVGGVGVEVTFYGNAPGYPGLQQINILLPPSVAGAGRAPVVVVSNGETSNAVFMQVLPTPGMMQGMPGWGAGMMVGENLRRGREMSYLAFNPANGTALVTDEEDDAVRVISLSSRSTVATITLPAGSEAHAIQVNPSGTLAAVALAGKGSVALLDLAQNKAVAVIATGNYPSHLAFSGASLYVTNTASDTVSVIDTSTRLVARTVTVGRGPSGLAVAGSAAVVANMQSGTVSLIDLNSYTTTTIPLPPGSRPHEVAISAATNKALITTPMSNGFLLLNLADRRITRVQTGVWNAMGPGAVVANGNLAFVANQMTASVTVVDTAAETIVRTFAVDPGPRALAVNAASNQLLVLAQGTGTLDLVDLAGYGIIVRINAGETSRQGNWTLPLVSSLSPNTVAVGSSFTLTINGSGFREVKDVEFHLVGGLGGGMGSGGMGGGMGAGAMGQAGHPADGNIKVTSVRVNAAGTQVTASVQILTSAAPGVRQVRLETDRGEIMGPMFSALFTVTAR